MKLADWLCGATYIQLLNYLDDTVQHRSVTDMALTMTYIQLGYNREP